MPRGRRRPRPARAFNHMIRAMLIIVAAGALVSFLASAGPMARLPHPCDIAYPSDARVKWECETLTAGQSLESVVGDRWEDVARFNRIDRRHARPGVAIKIPERIEDLEGFTPLPRFYPPAEWDDKFILVDLTEQF